MNKVGDVVGRPMSGSWVARVVELEEVKGGGNEHKVDIPDQNGPDPQALVRKFFHRWQQKTFTEKNVKLQELRKKSSLSTTKPTTRKKLWKKYEYFRYVTGIMPEWSNFLISYPLLDYIDYNLRGSGQVIFCNNPVSGLFILAAIFYGVPWLGVCATLGLVSATQTARFLGFNKGAIRAGLFGYNGVLVGAALGTFLADGSWSYSTAIAIAVMSAFSTVLASAIGNLLGPVWRVPTFTLPFNLSAIIFMLGCYQYFNFEMIPGINGGIPVPHQVDVSTEVWKSELPLAVLRGVSQVWLVNDHYSGVMIIVGMAFCSPISAAFALVGSSVGMLVAIALGVNHVDILAGLWGYNAVLGCVAMGGVFYVVSKKVVVLTIMCGMFCTILLGTFKGLFAPLGMPAFTFPFCCGTIIFILVQSSLPDVMTMPLPLITTPERHIGLKYRARKVVSVLRENAMKGKSKMDKNAQGVSVT